MELDGYCDKYKLAFEHQGRQHYKVDGFFIKSKKDLARRKKLDEIKIDLCNKMGIKLIVIPEIPTRLKVEKVKEYIKKECIRLKISLPTEYDSIDVDLRKAYTSEDLLEELKELAKTKGGICLSDVYLGTQSNMTWQCQEGHQWTATPNKIKRGSWCPICAGNIVLTIDEIKKIAVLREGECLSDEYVNNRTALLWRCKEGHEWKAAADNIKSGTWCPKCGIKKRADLQKSNIKKIQAIAKERKGKLISKKYKSTHSKLTWECEYGHQWDAVPSAVRRGSWCPTCAGNKKATLKDMRELAKNKGGKCLSEKYVSTHTKLLWECEKGHQWEGRPSGIKRGSWCPACAGNIKLTIMKVG